MSIKPRYQTEHHEYFVLANSVISVEDENKVLDSADGKNVELIDLFECRKKNS